MPSPHCNYKILKLQFQMQICYFQIAIPIFKIAIFNETFFRSKLQFSYFRPDWF